MRHYNVEYEIAALIFVAIMYVFVHRKYPVKSKKNLLFRIMCFILLITEALDIFSAYIIMYKDKFPTSVNLIFNTSYFMLGSLLCFLSSYYVDLGIIPKKGKMILDKTRHIVLYILEFAIFANLFFGFLFYVDSNNIYIHGPYFYLLHIVSVFYIIVAGITLTINWSKLDGNNKFLGVTIILLYIVPMILQIFFFQDTLLCMFGASLMLFEIFFSLETPDYIKLQKTLEVLEKTKNELMKSNKRNYELAYFDQMSGLYNRTAYEETIQKLSAVLEKVKKETNIIVFTADLNSLKYLNDNYGHAIGDDAIRKTAKLLSECFSKKEKCYRIGGDEFFVISIGNTIKEYKKSFNMFVKMAKKLNKEVDYPYSIACAFYVVNEKSINESIKIVDAKMYENKRKMKKSQNFLDK